ncbi:SigB/SigF/SigG family RNA polymerase sigma factor [Nocardia callitridis]|uniref:SigB/SigF/SigG family RNA polymerase sigma factor n=1 Tax=Nocardia callitridis TaxID=648753 RepID=A0ABP9K9N4_9NOCA
MQRESSTVRNGATRTARHGRNSYDDIEPQFEKMAGFEPRDPRKAEVRTEITRRCLPLAEHIARRYGGRGEPFDDLNQSARVGLVEAVDRFDVGRGTPFLSFAVPTIMGEVRKHFRDRTWSVRVPRGIKEIQARIGPATEDFAQRESRMPTVRELAADLELDVEQVTRAVLADNAYQANSLDGFGNEDGDEATVPPVRSLGSDEHCYELTEQAMTVRPLIAALPAMQRRVLIMRFFESMTQNQIAERLGVSQMQISRTLATTLDALRSSASAEGRPARNAA